MSLYPKRKIINCKSCFWTWENNSIKNEIECPRCSKKIDARDKSEYNKKRRMGNPQIMENAKKMFFANDSYKREARLKRNAKRRIRALLLVGKGKIECSSCSCDDVRLIEINHMNGGGRLETKGKSTKFYNDIVTLKRSLEDLNLLCRVCNARHYLEIKFGILPFKILWKK